MYLLPILFNYNTTPKDVKVVGPTGPAEPPTRITDALMSLLNGCNKKSHNVFPAKLTPCI